MPAYLFYDPFSDPTPPPSPPEPSPATQELRSLAWKAAHPDRGGRPVVGHDVLHRPVPGAAVTALPEAATAVEQLGEDVWETLAAAGHTPAPAGTRLDGFDVLRSSQEPWDHVAVVVNFDGSLRGLSGAGVRRACFYRLEQTLEDAGYSVLRYELGQVPHVLIVARDSQAAERGLAEMRAAVAPST